ALERDPADDGPVRDMFISAHTIKGGASMLGLEAVRELAHALEDVLSCLRDGGQALDQPTADLLFRAVDGLRERLEASASPGAGLDATGVELVAALRQRAAEAPQGEPPDAGEKPEAAPIVQPRALLIEDSATVRLLETMLLSEAGFAVETATDRRQALDLALV